MKQLANCQELLAGIFGLTASAAWGLFGRPRTGTAIQGAGWKCATHWSPSSVSVVGQLDAGYVVAVPTSGTRREPRLRLQEGSWIYGIKPVHFFICIPTAKCQSNIDQGAPLTCW